MGRVLEDVIRGFAVARMLGCASARRANSLIAFNAGIVCNNLSATQGNRRSIPARPAAKIHDRRAGRRDGQNSIKRCEVGARIPRIVQARTIVQVVLVSSESLEVTVKDRFLKCVVLVGGFASSPSRTARIGRRRDLQEGPLQRIAGHRYFVWLPWVSSFPPSPTHAKPNFLFLLASALTPVMRRGETERCCRVETLFPTREQNRSTWNI